MIDNKFRKYEPFFGKWRISKELGKGAFGQVFEIYWDDDLGSRSTSALKFIHIPSEEALREQKAQQPNMEAVRNYFLRQVERIKDEIRILQSCKGHSNIVSYEDHMIVENVGEDEIGWDILIRMELLYPLEEYFKKNKATQYDVMKMWLDISHALIFCDEQNIIHRDIKPANILISASGSYKLSDFGVARKNMQQDMAASTRVGTEKYMAPEVYNNGKKYDKRADYYSLGCVIYYFLNMNRHAFYPPYPQILEVEATTLADERRRRGDKIPPIPWVSKEINEILLKSMAHNPDKRQKNARDLYRAIQQVLEKQGNNLRQRELIPEVGSHSSMSASVKSKTGSRTKNTTRNTTSGGRVSHGKAPIIIACVFLVAGVGGIIYGVSSKKEMPQPAVQMTETVAVEPLTTEVITEALTTEAETEPPTTEVITEALTTEAETEPPTTEVITEALTTEAITEAPTTEAITEALTTEAETEPPTTEVITEALTTEAITEPPTTEEVTEALTTEAETETQTTEAPTETETETQTTEAPRPTARLFGMLERPANGDNIDGDIRVKGWVLANESVGDMEIYLDLIADGGIMESFVMEPDEMGENTFEKRQKKNAEEIEAAIGYEIKGSESITDLPEGEYDVELRIVEPDSGWEEVLDSVEVTVSGGRTRSEADLMEMMGLAEETQELADHYILEEKGFAIGLDAGEELIQANSQQILMTGWLNAATGTSLGMYVEVDSELYSADTLAEKGGSFEIIRAPRNLEKMDQKLIGTMAGDSEEAGYIISLNLPFLETGEHTIAVTFNVGLTEGQPEMVDMKPMTIQIDPSVPVEEAAEEKIAGEWEKEFPEPETEEQSEEGESKKTGE